jgi:pimeloyl-ACP methyl ester carboxylesterase
MGRTEAALKREPVGSIEMAWAEAGRGERAFVLVHGYTGSLDDFVDVLPALSEHGHTLLVDQRGHGGTTNPGSGYSFPQLVEDLRGFLDARGLERVDLLGHSMGGMVALRFALAHPERLHSLVLMDTSPGPVSLMPRKALQAAAAIGRSQGMATLFSVMKLGMGNGDQPPAMRRVMEEQGERYWQRIGAKIEAMDPEAMGQLGELLGEHPSIGEQLRAIDVPTTVLVGEQDAPFRGPSDEMAARLPNAELVVVPDAAHSPQFENPAAWLAAIRSHLARTRS